MSESPPVRLGWGLLRGILAPVIAGPFTGDEALVWSGTGWGGSRTPQAGDPTGAECPESRVLLEAQEQTPLALTKNLPEVRDEQHIPGGDKGAGSPSDSRKMHEQLLRHRDPGPPLPPRALHSGLCTRFLSPGFLYSPV